jgi:sugar lactone lactonase YvrE
MNRIVLMAAAASLLVAAGCESDKSGVNTPGSTQFQARVVDIPHATGGYTLSTQAMQQPEVAALFSEGPMPTGVAVDRTGRIFVNYPRWGDDVAYTVAEIRDGRAVPYPDDQITKLDTDHPADTLVSVQSVVTDGKGRLWIVDTGSINFGPVVAGGPKLVAVDLKTNKVVQKIPIPPDVCLATSYLNDARFDMGRGDAGTAYLTDSSGTGPNALIVVDLASGKCMRRLNDHPSTKAEPNFVPTVEGKPLMSRPGGGQPDAPLHLGVDGIALSPDGNTLYYAALCGHHLYTVDASVLSNPSASDDDVARTVRDLGDRGFASDGLECDDRGTLYLTDYEHNAVRVRNVDGSYGVLASDARLLWPDSMAIGIAPGGDPNTRYLYVTANQLERQKAYTGSVDRRQRPFVLFRIPIDAGASHPGGRMALQMP